MLIDNLIEIIADYLEVDPDELRDDTDILYEYDLRLRGRAARDRAVPRGEPRAAPPFGRAHRRRVRALPLLVQPLRVDGAALAHGGAGVGGRPRRARCGLRPDVLQNRDFPSTLRL